MPAMMRLCKFAVLTLSLVGTSAHATFEVVEPWVRPAAATRSTEAFMQLASSDPVTLVDVRCAGAAAATLVDAEGRSAAPLALPAGTKVSLAPGRTRLLLRKLDHALRPGDRVACSLTLRSRDGAAQEIAIDAEVRKRSAREDHHTHPN